MSLIDALLVWWRSHPLAVQVRAALTIAGLIVFGMGWTIRSATVTLVGAATWAPAASILVADWVSRGVGR